MRKTLVPALLAVIAVSHFAAATAQDARPLPVQDCAAGETVREVYAAENAHGGKLAVRMHFCIGNAQDGIRKLLAARRETVADTTLTAEMRDSLVRQLDAQLAELAQVK